MNATHFSTWKNYVRLELKKGLKLIPFFLVSTAVVLGTVLLAAVIFAAVMSSGASFAKAHIGIVTTDTQITVDSDDTAQAPNDAKPDFMTSMAINLVWQMDAVNTIADFSFMGQEEAAEGLENSTVDAVIYLGKDTYDNINNGTNTPILVKLSDSAASLQKDLFATLVSAGVRAVRTIEAAVYTPSVLADSYTLITDPGTLGDRIFDIYLNLGMNRSIMWVFESVSAFGSMTGTQFYTASALMMVLFLFGLGFMSFYSREERSIMRLMKRNGHSVFLLSGAKLLAMFLAETVFGAILLALVLLVNGLLSGVPAAESLTGYPLAFCHLMVATLLVTAFIHLAGTYLPTHSAAYGYLLLLILLIVTTGGLLPTAYLPSFLRTISVYSPVHLVQLSLSQALFPETLAGSSKTILTALAFSVGFYLLAGIGGVRDEA